MKSRWRSNYSPFRTRLYIIPVLLPGARSPVGTLQPRQQRPATSGAEGLADENLRHFRYILTSGLLPDGSARRDLTLSGHGARMEEGANAILRTSLRRIRQPVPRRHQCRRRCHGAGDRLAGRRRQHRREARADGQAGSLFATPKRRDPQRLPVVVDRTNCGLPVPGSRASRYAGGQSCPPGARGRGSARRWC